MGVNKVADKVAAGGGHPLLLMQWPAMDDPSSDIAHYAEFTYRVGEGASVDLPVVPAGLAWGSLGDASKDTDLQHPTPNGAYLSASAIYAHITGRRASISEYVVDDEIADHGLATYETARNESHFSGERSFMSPFAPAYVDLGDGKLNYNHTGTSSERGIVRALRNVTSVAGVSLVSGGAEPIDFNFGRANTNFESHKQYKVDPSRFDFSLGFPMQDHGSHGNRSMLFGLDSREVWRNATDVGVADKMIDYAELPWARAIPVRTLYAQIREIRPEFSAYSDSWHMSSRLNKATASYMYTLLTGDCALYDEPADRSDGACKDWVSYKVGYETAWMVMHTRAKTPCTG